MSNLRKLAKGQNCQVRLSCCNHDPTTVVLGHIRMTGISGLGYKAPDLLGAWVCSACHSYVDTHHDSETQMDFFKGVFRTQFALIEDGQIKW